MAGDAFLAKNAVISSATTTFPAGAITPGGAAVDEMDMAGLNLEDPLAAVCVVGNLTGALTTFAVSVEVSDDSAFTAPAPRTVAGPLSITTNGYHLLGWLPPFKDRYSRFKVVSTGAAVTGTLDCRLDRGADSRRLLVP
jgi:hypothetical protein